MEKNLYRMKTTKKLKPLHVLKEFKIWIKFFDVIKIYKENTLYRGSIILWFDNIACNIIS